MDRTERRDAEVVQLQREGSGDEHLSRENKFNLVLTDARASFDLHESWWSQSCPITGVGAHSCGKYHSISFDRFVPCEGGVRARLQMPSNCNSSAGSSANVSWNDASFFCLFSLLRPSLFCYLPESKMQGNVNETITFQYNAQFYSFIL